MRRYFFQKKRVDIVCRIFVCINLFFVFFFYNQAVALTMPTAMQKNSLLFKSWVRHSQFGEEGVLEEILARLSIQKGFFAEFGAWDGVYLSNTRFLVDRNWEGAYIEADRSRILTARKNFRNIPQIQCIHEFVVGAPTANGGKTFDQIADEFFPNKEIDVLSIDIDGLDYLILENLHRRPKIIIIEGGISFHPMVATRIPDAIAKDNINQPLSIIFDIAKAKGYKPICFTINTFLVRDDCYYPFKDIKNDPVSLWFDFWHYCKWKNLKLDVWFREFRKNPLVRKYDPFAMPN